MSENLDPTANYHGGADTSVEAWQSVTPESRQKVRMRVLRCIAHSGNGMTCAEVEAWTGITHQSASARITELRADGLIVDSGQRRRTSSGRRARVYVAVETKEAQDG